MQPDAIEDSSPRQRNLVQGAMWRSQGRLLYGVFAYPLFVGGMAASFWQPNSLATELLLLIGLSFPIVLGEWRVRRMGFRVSDEGIELVRALNCNRVQWAEIESFVAVGRGFYGNQQIWLRRRGRGKLPLPTVHLHKNTWPLPNGGSGLVWAGGRAADAFGFLEGQLAIRKAAPPETGRGRR
jgi:hypothetical protein